MITGLLFGCTLGLALCLLAYALFPPRPALSTRITRWERQRARHSAITRTSEDSDETGGGIESPGMRERVSGRVGHWMVTWLADRGIGMTKVRADLALTGTSLEAHMVHKLTRGLIGLLLPSVFTVVMIAIGSQPPISVPTAGGLLLGALLFWLPDLTVAQAANQKRDELRRGLAIYLSLVSMSLAGSRGIPEALPTSANIGTGWAFGLIRSAIDRARRIGTTPWATLGDLGHRTGMQELQDLGGALTLVADDGAKVKDSLSARAATLRRRQLAEAEGAAAKADQTITMAHIVLALGFMLFLGYPAVVSVMGI